MPGWTFVVIVAGQFIGYLSGAYIQNHLVSSNVTLFADPINGVDAIASTGLIATICLLWIHIMFEGKA